MADDLLGILYFLIIGYGPFVLLILSIFFLIMGYMKYSSRLVLVSILLFIPELLALLLIELEPILYVFLLLPVIQIFLYLKIRKLE
ncbi:hypothetical protein QL992_04480 [Microbacterium sp. APC 3898]|uniref:Uncharacterized protein n=1 Tax=Planococcus notacanthi TaxID=3035188 RepID=A0ABT7ZLK0_9BACL|nr:MULTISPECIES: hypothetical protein [Terrabacteria group]MDN3428006.1 hypothetical protein [Planococcus sp. APC 4016]MDN3498459.1 hypothetical protein [Microbacterium sp. APC 3898]